MRMATEALYRAKLVRGFCLVVIGQVRRPLYFSFFTFRHVCSLWLCALPVPNYKNRFCRPRTWHHPQRLCHHCLLLLSSTVMPGGTIKGVSELLSCQCRISDSVVGLMLTIPLCFPVGTTSLVRSSLSMQASASRKSIRLPFLVQQQTLYLMRRSRASEVIFR